MIKARPTAARDYSSLFLGMILSGLVAIVFVLMMAVSQSRARDAPVRPLASAKNSVLTPTVYFAWRGTN